MAAKKQVTRVTWFSCSTLQIKVIPATTAAQYPVTGSLGLPTAVFQSLMVALVLSRLDYSTLGEKKYMNFGPQTKKL